MGAPDAKALRSSLIGKGTAVATLPPATQAAAPRSWLGSGLGLGTGQG